MSFPYASTDNDNDDSAEKPRQIHINVPPRYYLLPGAAIILGTTIGLLRGSRRESLRFLAENVHRPPTTMRGWYLYNKTKNYRVMMAGLRQGGTDAARLAAAAAVFVAVEEGAERVGGVVGEAKDVFAGVGTGGVFSLLYRLPRKQTGRMVLAGLMIGGTVSGLRWGQDWLRGRAAVAKARVAEAEAEAEAKGPEEATDALETKA